MKFSKTDQLHETKPKKEKHMSYKQLTKKADDAFAEFIRIRDGHCYGQDIPQEAHKCHGYLSDCHLFPRGKKSLRYDEINNNAGCSYHNQIHNNGLRPQPHIYTNWFIKKYGQEAYDDLYRRSYDTKQWTREELNQIIEKYTGLVEEGHCW